MCRRNNEYPIPASHLYFRMSEIAGRWVQPRRGRRRYGYTTTKHAGPAVTTWPFAYDAKTVLRRPLRQMWGLCYFDLWGRIGLSYDHERDVLTPRGIRRLLPRGGIKSRECKNP